MLEISLIDWEKIRDWYLEYVRNVCKVIRKRENRIENYAKKIGSYKRENLNG